MEKWDIYLDLIDSLIGGNEWSHWSSKNLAELRESTNKKMNSMNWPKELW